MGAHPSPPRLSRRCPGDGARIDARSREASDRAAWTTVSGAVAGSTDLDGRGPCFRAALGVPDGARDVRAPVAIERAVAALVVISAAVVYLIARLAEALIHLYYSETGDRMN